MSYLKTGDVKPCGNEQRSRRDPKTARTRTIENVRTMFTGVEPNRVIMTKSIIGGAADNLNSIERSRSRVKDGSNW